jgi:RNA polymerase sigma factor (sigma-70 family)
VQDLRTIFFLSGMPPEPSTRDPTGLITAFKAGDVRAFEEVYRSRFEDLCAYVSALVSDDDAGDVVHDVLFAIWEARERLTVHTEEELFYYLLRAVRNRAIKMVHRDRVRDVRTRQMPVREPESAEDSSLVEHVRTFIDGLPERSREVLILRWYHGLGLEHIASIMDISYGSARVLHTRAMAALRERLTGQ